MTEIERVYENALKEMKNEEGCKMSGFVYINKVPGNFHISGHHYPQAVQRLFMEGHAIDFSHKINHLSFGELKDIEHIEANFGEKFNFELDGRDIVQDKYIPPGGMMGMGGGSLMTNYFLEISQVDYVDKTSQEAIDEKRTLEAFQFRSSQTIKQGQGMPAIFWRYELSPIRIQYTMYLQSVSPFLVHICAIVGGIYAVSSIVESVIRNSMNIFALGAPDLDHNTGAMGKHSTMKKVKKAQVKTIEATNINMDDNDLSSTQATDGS